MAARLGAPSDEGFCFGRAKKELISLTALGCYEGRLKLGVPVGLAERRARPTPKRTLRLSPAELSVIRELARGDVTSWRRCARSVTTNVRYAVISRRPSGRSRRSAGGSSRRWSPLSSR